MSNARPSQLPDREIHDVLRNDRRRTVLEYLQETGEATIRELAELVARTETGESPPPRRARESAYAALHQTHLPKLDDLGIVHYDTRSKEVEPAEHLSEVERYLDGSHDDEGGLHTQLFGIAVLIGIIGAAVGVPGFAAIGPLPIAIFGVGGFVALLLAGQL